MKTVFVDIDTQWDFLSPSGALSVPGAARLAPRFVELNRFAASRGIPVVSTTDAHGENDADFRVWPADCIAGTLGQHKPSGSLLEGRVVLPSRPGARVASLSIAGKGVSV